MDEFSRVFFPLKFDKPNNSGSRFLFPKDREGNKDRGIFWFENIAIGENHNCKLGRDNEIEPADIFIDYLLNVSLQFAQQHVVSTDKLDDYEGCWKEGAFYFKTEDSAGLVGHGIYPEKIKLGGVFKQGISKGAGWRFLILLLISCAVWCFILSFFSRRVFGIFISEPTRHHSALLDEAAIAEKNNLIPKFKCKLILVTLKKSHLLIPINL